MRRKQVYDEFKSFFVYEIPISLWTEVDRIFSIVPDRCQILLYEKQGQPEAPARPVSDAEPGGRTGKRSPHLYQGNPALCCH